MAAHKFLLGLRALRIRGPLQASGKTALNSLPSLSGYVYACTHTHLFPLVSRDFSLTVLTFEAA